MSEYDVEVGSLAMLIGGKIKALCHTPEEDGYVYWGFEIVVDGTVKTLWLLSDFEDNAPGAWSIE